MTRLNALNLQESNALFNTECLQIPVRLRRLPNARVLWLNERVMADDSRFIGVGGTAEAYAAHILDCCGFTLAEEDSHVSNDDETIGFADRYGGAGIGRNGGSGRAAVVNGYHVKGIGRTPLLSVITDEGHGSGVALLEECVRETIFSEIVAAEFPGGSIPTLAIIETGHVHVVKGDDGLKQHRCCLLVRPSFVRPAHFERAPKFISKNPKEGSLDSERVRGFFEAATNLLGQDELVSVYWNFWQRWAEQLAYAYVHRLSHGGNNTSNLCLDGCLLDFGAMAAMPSWARVTSMTGGPPSGSELAYLSQAMQLQQPFLGRYLDPRFATQLDCSAVFGVAAQRYTAALWLQALRLVGLTRLQATKLLNTDGVSVLTAALNRLFSHYQREQLTIFDGTPSPRISWDIEKVWSAQPPSHLAELRSLLENLLDLRGDITGPSATRREVLAKTCILRSRNREFLYRENVKRDVYAAMETTLPSELLTPMRVSEYVAECIAKNRRDCRFEPDNSIPIGFAQNSYASYALFNCLSSGQNFAIQEWNACAKNEETCTAEPLVVIGLTSQEIVFANHFRPSFVGAVGLTHQ